MATDHTTRSRNFLIYGGYAVLFAGFAIAGVVPCVRSMAATKSEINKRQDDIASRQAGAARLQDVEARIERITAITKDYERLVPTSEDLGLFLEHLSTELTDAHIRDVSVGKMGSSPLQHSVKIPISVHGKGSFPDVQKFLTRLEGFERLSSVGRVCISTPTEMNGSIDLDITLFIYNSKPN